MKKLLFLCFSAFCLFACSVDTLEMEVVESQLFVAEATYQINGCDITIFNFGDAGTIEVRNDLEFIHVKISATGDYELVQSNLHLSSSISGFPSTKSEELL